MASPRTGNQPQCSHDQCVDACGHGCGLDTRTRPLKRRFGTDREAFSRRAGPHGAQQRPRDALAALSAAAADNEPRPRTNGPRQPGGIENPRAPALAEAAVPPPPPPQPTVATPPAARVVPPPTGGAVVDAARAPVSPAPAPAWTFSWASAARTPQTRQALLRAAAFRNVDDDNAPARWSPLGALFSAKETTLVEEVADGIRANAHHIASRAVFEAKTGNSGTLDILGLGSLLGRLRLWSSSSGDDAYGDVVDERDVPRPMAPLAAAAAPGAFFGCYDGAEGAYDAPTTVVSPADVEADVEELSERRQELEAALLRKRRHNEAISSRWEEKRDEGTATRGGLSDYCDASGRLVRRDWCTERCEPKGEQRVACGGGLCPGEDGEYRPRHWCRCDDIRCGGGFCSRSHKRRGECMCGDLRCGFNKPRQILSRMINKAFAPNLTNDQIDVGLGYTAKQLREALLKTSPWDEATTIDKWNRGELQVDHIIPLARFRDRGAFVDANGMPTPLAFEANALWNLQLLEAAVNREKSDSYTATCAAGLARRKACFVAARGGTESFDSERYLELLVADVRAGNHSIGAPAKEP